MMKCLVTGAAGFIGNALVKRLIEEGYDVIGLIHKTKPKDYEKKAKYVEGDITDIESVKPFFKDVDFVFHCAALVKDYGPKKIFYKINLEGTKNLVKLSEEFGVKRFIFLSHVRYESEKSISYYSKTKALAEQNLKEKYKQNGFPVVIIRPGNVYGPGATTWVLRPYKSIQKNRITLIDHGNGIFHHTYIDNLLDAMIAALKTPKALGETIDVTDEDNSVTYGEYLNTLAKIAGKPPIKRDLSINTAFFVSNLMMFLNKVFRIEPWVTPMTVRVLTNNHKFTIEKAKQILNYNPKVDYSTGMKRVEDWLKKENNKTMSPMVSFLTEKISVKFNFHKLKKFADLGFIIIEKILIKFKKLHPLYFDFYDEMVENEIKLANISKNDKILHIGGGSIPATSILLTNKIGAQVTIIDKNLRSVKQATSCISEYGVTDRIQIKHAEAKKFPVDKFDVIIVSQGIRPYRDLLKHVSQSMKADARVIFRTSSSPSGEITPNDLFLKDIFKIEKIAAQKQNGLLLSILLLKK